MYYIKEAKVTRLTEIEGVVCAEIAVSPGAVDDPELLVYVSRSVGNGSEAQYEIIRMLWSDAGMETDWFNNDLHQAYGVIAEEQFGDEGWPEPAVQREQFKQLLLEYSGVTESLKEKFSSSSKSHKM
ncbi:hypothetical protein DMN77_15015 [Paenibacillus sp. 79R4]|uniref:hypothetical protein n=1 Tax=Paenibacillus sp. 79R4 TaxID=2212847 RepID=UPI0015BFAA97|nr:hypothetical protein [Paenibacillus sp. 79R4]NWL88872.1 hypothetical protein [Paenibacillus sp. 79R4]